MSPSFCCNCILALRCAKFECPQVYRVVDGPNSFLPLPFLLSSPIHFLPLFLAFSSLFLPSPPQYYSEANEADSWMNEKAGLAASQDYGKDEDAATKYLKTHAVSLAVCMRCRLNARDWWTILLGMKSTDITA